MPPARCRHRLPWHHGHPAPDSHLPTWSSATTRRARRRSTSSTLRPRPVSRRSSRRARACTRPGARRCGGVEGGWPSRAKCFEHFHPNGMKVNAGSVVLEPGLTDERLRRDASTVCVTPSTASAATRTRRERRARRPTRPEARPLRHVAHGGNSIPGSSRFTQRRAPAPCGPTSAVTSTADEPRSTRTGSERCPPAPDMALRSCRRAI